MDLATVIYGESSKPTQEELTKLMEDIGVQPNFLMFSVQLLLSSIANVIHKWYPNIIRTDDELVKDARTILNYIQGRDLDGLTKQQKQDISSTIDSLMKLKIDLPQDNRENILYVAVHKAANSFKDSENNKILIGDIKEKINYLKEQPQSESSFWYIGLFIVILCIVIYLFTRATYRGKRRR